jgi:diguanylate cyclase (GGDEF)-like protein/PAS domain S-box-containing protein
VVQSSFTPLQRIKRHSLWLLVALFFTLSYFAIRNLSEKIEEHKNAVLIEAWTDISIAFNRLIHELQKERGMSSGFISSDGANFGREIAQQRQQTDVAVEALQAATRALPADAATLAQLSRGTLAELDQLAGLRGRIGELRLSRDAAVDRYDELIAHMFEHLLATMSVGRVGWIVRQQMAFLFYLQAKEMAGQERALITAMLSAQDFGAARMSAYYRIKAIEHYNTENFLRLAEEPARNGYLQIMDRPFVAEAEQVRRLVFAVGASRENSHPQMPDPTAWFALATQKIDALSQYEDVLSGRLISSARAIAAAAEQSLAINAIVVLFSFSLGIVLLIQIWHGKNLTETNLHLAGEVFSNSVESIIVTDADANIIDVNPAFTRITGYSHEEALGRNPRLLKSGRHDPAFYAALWDKLLRTGSWEGEIWNRRKNGSLYPALLSIAAVQDAQGVTSHYIAMTVDLSKFKETEALLEQLRSFDPLTGLPNRESWHSAVDLAVAHARRTAGRFVVLDIGLDRFKMINESFGHAVGDQVLIAAAEQIKPLLRRHDVAARPSGNHFAILLPDMDDPGQIGAYCERLLAAFAVPLKADGRSLSQSITIGAALYPSDGADTRTLLQNAESALHAARDEGGARYLFYSAEMNAAGAKLLALEQMLRHALDRNEFTVFYQPQVDAGDGTLRGVEALIRWHNPELGSVSPVQFIPLAETTGLIVPIGEWVLRSACLQGRLWRDKFGAEIQIAVNLSARQFVQAELLATVQLALDDSGLPSRLLELEITEGSLMSDPAGATAIMQGLRMMGVKLALDDFGTGYSSLAYLKNFPLDRLKLDRAFVTELVSEPHDQAIAQAVISLGHVLDMDVLAEGVETAEQSEMLGRFGCDVFQGYLFGKPMSAAALEAEIAAGRLVPRPPGVAR